MKFSGKMCFKIILKVTKNQGFTLSLEDTFFEKPGGGVKKIQKMVGFLPSISRCKYKQRKTEFANNGEKNWNSRQ